MSKEPKHADKTKVILCGTSTVADVEARMQKVLEEVVIPINKKWEQYKKDNPNYLNEGPNYNTQKPFDESDLNGHQ